MDIKEVLDQLQIDFKSHGESSLVTEGWVGIVCPWCGDGTGKYGLGIHLHWLNASCWKCGKHWLPDVLSAASGVARNQAIDLVKGLDRPLVHESAKVGKLILPEGIGPLKGLHRRYLKGRKLDPDEMEAVWGLQGIGLAKKLSWRIFFPIQRRGKMISWMTRACSDKAKLRYVGAKKEEEAFPAREWLYGLDLCGNSIIVVEGHVDALRVGPGAAATGGTGFSETQARIVAKFPQRTIVFDPEPEAQRRARNLADAVSVFPGKTNVVVLDSGDPGAASDREIRQLRKHFL